MKSFWHFGWSNGGCPFPIITPEKNPMKNDRCCEDRSCCRSCPEKCYPDDEPMEAKEPTALDRFTYGFNQWVSKTKLPDLFTQVANVIQRVKKKE